MKNYNEIANSVFERREQYETEKKQKRKMIVRTVAPICSVCLVALLGFGAWQSGIIKKTPLQTAEDSVIIGEKDWYGPGEERTTKADAEKTTQKAVENNNPTVKNENEQPTEANRETATETQPTTENNGFCEIILTDSYHYEIQEGEFSKYFAGMVIEASKIGSKIDDVTVAAGWESVNGGWTEQENLRAEVFAIDGIEKNVAVALKFIDKGEALTTTHYYVVMNPDADLSEVSEYIIPSEPENSGEIVPE